MKRLGAVFVLIWTLQCGNAWADNFSGLYVTAGGTFLATLGKDYSNFGADGSFTTTNADLGKDSFQTQLTLGYLYRLSDKFLIGLEIGKQLGQPPALEHSTSSNMNQSGDLNSEARQWKMGSGWWLALKPSVNLGKDSLAFVKLSKHWSSGTFNGRKGINCTDAVNATGCDFPSTESFSASTSGTGFGTGLQTRLTDKVFVMIEVERIVYGKISRTIGTTVDDFVNTDSLKPKAYRGTISLGYWF